MARKEFLDYVWKYCIEPQLGYSFSLNHTLPYSLIAVQEANLATRWDPLYWKCACLCVNAGNYVKDMGDGDEEEDTPEEVSTEETTGTKEKRVAPSYDKIAAIIDGSNLSAEDKSRIKASFQDINVADAQATYQNDNMNNQEIVVALTFTDEGRQKFADAVTYSLRN